MNKYFAATVLSFIIVLGTIRAFHIYQIAAPTPDQAVSKYYAYISKGSPMEGETIRVTSTTPITEGKTLIAALRASSQDPDVAEVGYALTKKTIFGWYVQGSQIYGTSPRPEDVIARLDQFDQEPVVYGQVLLSNAARVEAVFNNGMTVTSDIPDGNFALLGSPYQELLEFKILDSNGEVLKHLNKDELLSE